MIIDDNIQLLPNWKTHVQTDGSNIGGVPPRSYGMILSPPKSPNGLLFFTNGSSVAGGYADWEAYISRPLQTNTGILQLDFDLTVDKNSTTAAQAIETDTILCINGWNYDFSMQLNYAEGGKVQIDKAGGGWVDVGGGPGKLTPDVPHHYSLVYEFDITKQTGSVVAIQIDGVFYIPGASLRNLPAQNKKWADGAILQIQQDLSPKGSGSFSMLLENVKYTWS